VETFRYKSIEEKKVMNIDAHDREEMSGMDPLICHKNHGELPSDKKEAKAIKRKSA